MASLAHLLAQWFNNQSVQDVLANLKVWPFSILPRVLVIKARLAIAIPYSLQLGCRRHLCLPSFHESP